MKLQILLLKAANLIVSFAKSLELKNAEVNLIQDKGYTPVIYIDIPSTRQNDSRTILFYAHFDKQPYGIGWDEDKIRSAIKFSGDNIEDLDSGEKKN